MGCAGGGGGWRLLAAWYVPCPPVPLAQARPASFIESAHRPVVFVRHVSVRVCARRTNKTSDGGSSGREVRSLAAPSLPSSSCFAVGCSLVHRQAVCVWVCGGGAGGGLAGLLRVLLPLVLDKQPSSRWESSISLKVVNMCGGSSPHHAFPGGQGKERVTERLAELDSANRASDSPVICQKKIKRSVQINGILE